MAAVQLEANVDVLSSDEMGEAIAATLERLGMSFNELAAEAAAGEFRSEQARLTWFMVDSRGVKHH